MLETSGSGIKAQQDRTVLIFSYKDMVKFFRIPHKDRLTTQQIAEMSNKTLNRACRDLYNGVTIKQARKYGIKRGIIKKPVKVPFMTKARRFLYKAKKWFISVGSFIKKTAIELLPYIGNPFGIGVKHG